MIDVLFEQNVTQNPGLGAESIFVAVSAAYEAKERTEGVPFSLAFIILPLVFHRRSAIALAGKTQPGAIYKAISEEREIVVGLQERMEAMSNRTLDAIALGLASELFLLDKSDVPLLVPNRRTQPIQHVTEEVKTILKASTRVGQALAELSPTQLVTHLQIRF